jgi:hypothetical protein
MSAYILNGDEELIEAAAAYAKRLYGHDTQKSYLIIKNLSARIRKERADAGLPPLTMLEVREKTLEELQRLISAAPVGCSALITYAHGCALFKLDELLKVLNQHGASLGLNTFAGRNVEPSHDQRVKGFDGREVGVFELIALNDDAFAARLGGRIAFGKDAGAALKSTPCPTDLRRAVFGQTHRLGDIEIRRVAHTPIWRDGVLHATPGFDKETHTWIEAPEVILPTPCDRGVAIRAHEYLCSWLSEFPFASPRDRAVALGSIISAAMRASVRAPAIIITKPTHGAGASTLTDLIHVVLTGRTAPVINGGNPKEEIDKEVNAAQRAGRAALVLDNIPAGGNGGFNSVAVAQAITAETRQIRILGLSEAPTVECSQLVILNGVNVRIADDLVRRSLVIELDPQMERPEARAFKRPTLIQDAQRDRVEILKSAFTIIAAYQRNGERVEVQSIAGFDYWCQTVGAALKWLGEPDLATSQEKLKEDDPASQHLHTLADACRVLFGNQSFTAAHLNGEANPESFIDERGTKEEQQARKDARADLEHLFEEIATDPRGRVTSKQLGYFLRRNKGRVVGNCQLEMAARGHNNTSRWQFRRLDRINVSDSRRDDDNAANESSESDESNNWDDASKEIVLGANSCAAERKLREINVTCSEDEVERVRAAFFNHGLSSAARAVNGCGKFIVTAEATNEAEAKAITTKLCEELGAAPLGTA